MWSVQGGTALWESKLLLAAIDLARPERGLYDLVLDGRPLPTTRLLQMQLESNIDGANAALAEECHRATDLTAIYAETEEQSIQLQLHWRITESLEPPRVVLDFLVSAQTSQLDSDPRLRVSSSVGGGPWRVLRQSGDKFRFTSLDDADELCGCPAGVYVAPFSDARLFYAQLLLPSDEMNAIHSQQQSNGICTLQSVVFSERLEKGVIRRARIRGVMSEYEIDERVAVQLAEQLRATAFPLSEAS